LSNYLEHFDDVNRMLEIFRFTAKGVEVPFEGQAWMQRLLERTVHGGYIRSTVRREIMRGLQYELKNVSREKMDEIRRMLTGVSVRQTLDETVEMYI
jgi:chloramphenicol 3-O-phosphotransferase